MDANRFEVPMDETPAFSPEQQEQLNPSEVPQEAPAEELILGKFKSQEDLINAYQELETRQSQQTPETPPTEGSVGELLTEIGDHYAENGELTDEQYQQLESAGIGRDYVESYIGGIKAQQSLMETQLMGIVGGQENYGEMMQWMNANLQPDEVQAYDRVIQSGNVEEIGILIRGMHARYQSASGTGPQTQLQGTPAAGLSGYRSKGEILQAMSDPRYETDEAYRNDVSRKMSVTPDSVW